MPETGFHNIGPVREILLISLSCIGDVLLTTPVMRVLKDHFPDARLTVLAGRTSHELVAAHELVDRALVFDNKDEHKGTAGKARLVRMLRRDRYDLVVDLRNSAIPYFLRTRWRITSHRAHLRNRDARGRHAIDRHLDVLALHGFPITTRRMSITVPDAVDRRVRELMSGGALQGGPVFGVYPGAGSPYKQYPAPQFAEAVRLIAGQHPDARFALVGGPGDAEAAAEVARAVPGRCADFSAKLNILETAAVIRSCSLFISNDSGPMHIAAALDIPTVAIFGPTDAHRYGPRCTASRIVWRREPCNPCKAPECGQPSCIGRIAPADIADAAADLLGARAPHAQRADLAVVIVSYKTRDLLDKCLDSVMNRPCALSLQVIVVDNNSGDGTAEMVREKHPGATLIANEQNTGYSVANNQGIRASRARHVLLLNPDTESNPAALEAMVNFLDRHETAGAAGVQLLNSDGSLQESHFRFPVPMSRRIESAPWYPALSQRLLNLTPPGPPIREQGALRVDIIKGACLMCRGEALERVGLLDENSFLYADDIDWCMRARRAGWDAYLLTDHTILHHGWASTSQETYLTITSSRRSALLLYRKHYPALFVAVWTLFIFLEILYKYLLNGLRVKTGRANRPAREKFMAYRDLFNELILKRAQPGGTHGRKPD
jgi:lipopolysaccharide heptosyltransferase II